MAIHLVNNANLAVINGKTYTLHRAYHYSSIGYFFIAVSGRTPLKPDDIEEHWIVERSGSTYIAFAARYFSYHLLAGENTVAPNTRWKLKTTTHFAFVGPTEESMLQQLNLLAAQYRFKTPVSDLLEIASHAHDVTGNGPDAILIRAAEF